MIVEKLINHCKKMIDYKIIVRLLFASAFNIKNVKRIKFDLNNILLFDYLEYVKINC